MNITLLHGDCREQLQLLIDQGIQVDSIVTDPPYEMGFMGKSWDGTGIANDVDMWKLCLQVLKPGGHLLSFGGTRTYHRMTCAIEDSGFEIRDCVNWIYGSGFPKSHDVSKAIDRMAGAERKIVGKDYSGKQNIGATGITVGDFNITAPSTDAAKQWLGFGTALKPAHEKIVMAHKPYRITDLCDELVREIIKLCQLQSSVKIAELNLELSRHREIEENSARWLAVQKCNSQEDLLGLMVTLPLGSAQSSSLSIALSWLRVLEELSLEESMFTIEMKTNLITDLKTLRFLLLNNTQEDITLGAINLSGTGSNACLVQSSFNVLYAKLKATQELFAQDLVISKTRGDCLEGAGRTAHEPIVLARKPLSEKNIASNVLKHGVGAINIDGCRVDHNGDIENHNTPSKNGPRENSVYRFFDEYVGENPTRYHSTGRWPANIIHDGSDEVEAEFAKYGEKKTGALKPYKENGKSWYTSHDIRSVHKDKDTGSASRFFNCAKASKRERNLGLDKRELSTTDDGRNKPIDNPFQRGETLRHNNHPTVKPIALMSYLCRLVTPPNGTVLDPFLGSGSTGIAAKQEGFSFIGIEKEADYMEIAKARIGGSNGE